MEERELDSEYCQEVIRVLKLTNEQACMTNSTVYNFLTDYIKTLYKTDPIDFQQQWQLHTLQLDHPYTEFLHRNLDENVTWTHLKGQTITRNVITTEMRNVYTTLQILRDVFKEIMNKKNETNDELYLLHKLDNNQTKFDEIRKFFRVAQQHVGSDLEQTEAAMIALNIDAPAARTDFAYNRESPVLDWLLVVEQLSVMRYLIQLYREISSQCENFH